MSVEPFRGSPRPTLGVELELQLVDARSLDLVPAADDLIAGIPEALRESVKPEFFPSCAEVNTGNDPNNCGHCGNICPLRPNSMAATCMGGQCVNTCVQGFGDCDNQPNNGCEANLQTNLNACGGCGKSRAWRMCR